MNLKLFIVLPISCCFSDDSADISGAVHRVHADLKLFIVLPVSCCFNGDSTDRSGAVHRVHVSNQLPFQWR